MQSFWHTLTRPITILAPMEDVTDTVFRRIVAGIAKPDVFFTEFTSVDGLFSKGRDAVIHRLDYTEAERPIVAQIWGNSPELFFKAAELITQLKFDGIDINMGCPEKSVSEHHAGAACILDPSRAAEIIVATKEGSQSAGRRIPVSVKTRIGYKKISDDWIPFLLEQQIDALTIHGRTAAELSKVPTHWDEIRKAVTLRDQMKSKIIIIGNGDVVDYADAAGKCQEFGTDGAMIGRGIFHNLWAFDKKGISHMNDHKELFRIMREHVRLFDDVWGATKNFAVLKKFFKIYVHGFPNASEFREKLMQCSSPKEVEEVLTSFVV